MRTGICPVCQAPQPINVDESPEAAQRRDEEEELLEFLGKYRESTFGYLVASHDNPYGGRHCEGSGQIPQFLVRQ